MVRDTASPNVDEWGWATIFQASESAVQPMHIHKFHNNRLRQRYRIRRPPAHGCPRIRRPSDSWSLVSTLGHRDVPIPPSTLRGDLPKATEFTEGPLSGTQPNLTDGSANEWHQVAVLGPSCASFCSCDTSKYFCGWAWSPVYFVLFMITTSFIMLNCML